MSTDHPMPEITSAPEDWIDDRIEATVARYWREEIARAIEETGEAVLVDLYPRVWARLDPREREVFVTWALHDVVHFPAATLCRRCGDQLEVAGTVGPGRRLREFFDPNCGVYYRDAEPAASRSE